MAASETGSESEKKRKTESESVRVREVTQRERATEKKHSVLGSGW